MEEQKRKRGRPKKIKPDVPQIPKTNRLMFYKAILRKIALAGAISRAVLYDGEKSDKTVHYILDKAVKNKHIEIREYREIYGERIRSHKYYSITANGLEFLRLNDDTDWCRSIPDMKATYVAIFPEDRRQAAIAFNTRCGNSMLFAMSAGAALTNFVFTGQPDENIITSNQVKEEKPESPDEEKWWEQINDVDMEDFTEEETGFILDSFEGMDALGLFDEIQPESTEFTEGYEVDELCEAEGDYQSLMRSRTKSLADIKAETFVNMALAPDEEWFPGARDILFFPSKEIKRSLLGSESVKYTDFAYGQYTGLLTCATSSMIIYHAKHDGIGWSDRVEQKDIKTMRQFSVKCSPFDNIGYGKIYGAILVYNAKNFADIVNNKWEKRKVGTSIGKSFDTMHLIPLSTYGNNLMAWLLTNSQNERTEYEDSIAQASGLSMNKGSFHKVFRYMDGNTVVMNGMEMDIKKIQGVQVVKKKSGEFDFKVLCFRWQENYYHTLWPNVPLIYAD